MSSADFAAVHALLRASHARARYGAPPQHAHQQRSAVHNVLERLRTWQRHEIARQLPPEADKGSTSSQSAACGGARTAIATQVSAGFLPFAQQLLRNLRTLGLLHTVVALAEDAASTRELARWPLRRVIFEPALSTNVSRLVRREADAQFYAMAVHKIIFVDALLRVGLDVLFLDADISLLCNPLPLLARAPAAVDALVVEDLPAAPLRSAQGFHGRFNGGVFFVRANARTRRALADALAVQRAHPPPYTNDQSQLNLAVERGARRRGAARLSVAALDAEAWQMGPARRKLRHAGRGFARLPVLVHFNGQRSAMGKVELARSEGLWQADNATASLWRGFRERHARTLLGGCEAMPCTSGNATS